jgi:hypothetical protein
VIADVTKGHFHAASIANGTQVELGTTMPDQNVSEVWSAGSPSYFIGQLFEPGEESSDLQVACLLRTIAGLVSESEIGRIVLAASDQRHDVIYIRGVSLKVKIYRLLAEKAEMVLGFPEVAL